MKCDERCSGHQSLKKKVLEVIFSYQAEQLLTLYNEEYIKRRNFRMFNLGHEQRAMQCSWITMRNSLKAKVGG